MTKPLYIVLLTLLATPSTLLAAVKPAAPFGDHMVLQQETTAPVWGTASPHEQVTVTISGQSRQTTTDDAGKWRVDLDKLPTGGPFDLTIAGSDGQPFVAHDVLVGEVWLASGQSNMEFTVSKAAKSFAGTMNEAQEIAAADYPHIRMFTVPLKLTDTPQSDVQATWQVCSPETVGAFSAAAYFFARDLRKHRNVPVGILTSAYGASAAQAWIRKDALAAQPHLVSFLTDFDAACAAFTSGEAQKSYEQKLADWEATTRSSTRPGKPPRKPGAPKDPHNDQHNPSLCYNAMIAPLLPYGIRGVIWYQGESNGVSVDRYEDLMVTLIKDWRAQFNRGDFPFIQVQLAAYQAPTDDPNKHSVIAAVREAQQRSANAVPNGGLVTAIDIGDEKNVHPKNKQEVGRRLALAAESLAYHEQVESSGPTFKSQTIEGNSIRIQFDHTGGGLVSKGEKLSGFAIASAGRQFVWADARIDGGSVIVSSPQVAVPAAVRYAWADYPAASLFIKEGLPALPFRTDPPSASAPVEK